MSAERIIHCDRCGDRIEAGRVVLKIEAGASPPGWALDHESGRPAIDLCSAYFATLTKWLKGDRR
jgi:hypothetical protein